MKSISRILVTGGAGFIGSHLVDNLLAKGFEVTILDNFSTGDPQNVRKHEKADNLTIVKGDIRNTVLVKEVTKNTDAIFHEAALIDIPRSIKNPLLFNDVNVSGTLNLLLASSKANIKRFIFASSAAVYGNLGSPKKTERTLTSPISPYAVSKLAAESYVQVFSRQYGLETVCLRYFNVYGPRQATTSYSGVIKAFIERLRKKEPPIIHGDGKQTRDFIHVNDVVSANILALESKKAVGEIINIASGSTTTIYELAMTLVHMTKMEQLEPIFVESRSGDIKHCTANIGKAKKLLGFHPEITLKEGLSNLTEIE